jgi:DNA-binding HxlR family transcriptional regulator
MRSYGQHCALARALDVIGDRWTLLIVRELFVRPCRYGDLRDGLPGIATNLLADRLRSLEAAGVVVKEDATPPVATPVYHLSAWGQQLWPVLRELTRWATPLMVEGRGDDQFRGRWLQPAVRSITEGLDLEGIGPVRIRIVADDDPVDVVVADGALRSELHGVDEPDLVLTGDGGDLLGVLTGAVPLAEAEAERGVVAEGPASARADLDELSRRAFAELGPRLAAAVADR